MVTSCDLGSVVVILVVVDCFYLRQLVSEWFPPIPPDVWKVVNGIESILATLAIGEDVVALMITRSSRVYVFLGHPKPIARVGYLFLDPLLPIPSKYHISYC
ncbi:hypothetical protein TNCV_4752691 [Trichonephila clavipes]|nr:hypothetical protein TNCV_4752691 [Trichonephila clavipes]